MLPDGFPQPYKQPSLPPSLRFPRTWEIDWVDVPPRLPLRFAPALVQQSTVRAITSGTTDSVTLTVTAGNCLIVAVVTALSAGAGVAGTPTDPNNQWTPTNAIVNANSGGCRSTWYYANNARGGSTTITMTLASAVITNWEVYEFSGVGPIAGNRTLADSSNGQTVSGTATTATLSPQQSGSLALALVGDGGTATTWTKDGSSTSLSQTTASIDFASSYRVLSSTSVTAVTLSFTASGGAVQFAWAGLILRPAGQQATLRASTNINASATSLTSSVIAVKLGDVVFVESYAFTSGVTTTGVTDALGSHTWTKRGTQVNGANAEQTVWSTVITTAGTLQAVAAFSGTTAAHINVVIPLGVIASSDLFDTVVTATGNSTSPSVTSGTLGIANETVLLFVSTQTNVLPTQDGSSTLHNADSRGTTGSSFISSRVVASTGAVTMSGTITIGQWSAILIPLKTGGVSFVQSFARSGNSTSTDSTTATFNTAPGNAFLVHAGVATSKVMSSITDGINTYSEAVAQINGTVEGSLWSAKNVAGGKVTVAFNRSGTSSMGAVWREYLRPRYRQPARHHRQHDRHRHHGNPNERRAACGKRPEHHRSGRLGHR
jgi:hypothetical protein